jgi:hypothetical protein
MLYRNDIKQSLVTFFNEAYQGNQAAVMLAITLFDISQAWDDLIDGDSISTKDINQCFLNCLFVLPTNPIAQAMPELPHHIYNVFLRWRDATWLERNEPTEDNLNKCYMLRAGFYDIFVLIAAKLYGDDYARRVGPAIRKFYGEKLNEYKQEFQHG